MCYIQRQPGLPAHENIQVTAISYSLALFLLVIHTLFRYFRIIDKKKPLSLIPILPRPETQLYGSQTVQLLTE